MVAALSAALAMGFWLPGHISITLTPSLGYRVFFLAAAGEEPFREGDYLLFSKRIETATTDRLLKRVGCAPGQRLSAINGEYACDGHFLGRAMSRDSKGKPLPQFAFNGEVPPDSLFMVGPHPRSYDSRYFGFIHADSVLNKAHPLW